MNKHDSFCTSPNRVHTGLIFLAAAVLAVTTPLASGETPRSNARRAAQVGDTEARREVLATDDRRREALLRGDPAPLRQIYADDYTLVTRAGGIRTKLDQINDLTSGRMQYVKVEESEQTVRVYGDVVVIVLREKSDRLSAGQQVGGDAA